jgi:hypothetical protein
MTNHRPHETCLTRAFAAALAGLLLSGCGGAAEPEAAPARPGDATLARLPLQVGFYVANGTPCGEASNATLSLFLGNGLNGARDACEFVAVEATSARAWRVTERCQPFGHPAAEAIETVRWTSENDRSFLRVSESGWEHSARFCPQQDLPEPWRDNDLSDL